MIDFITKKAQPDNKLSFMPKKKKKNRSKSGKQKIQAPPKKVFSNEQALNYN